jgi:hypothetical protein
VIGIGAMRLAVGATKGSVDVCAPGAAGGGGETAGVAATAGAGAEGAAGATTGAASLMAGGGWIWLDVGRDASPPEPPIMLTTCIAP